jgi:hypothetical protein
MGGLYYRILEIADAGCQMHDSIQGKEKCPTSGMIYKMA